MIKTSPPYVDTVVSVGLARPFWTFFSILNAISAICSLEWLISNSSLIAARVATVTAAEEPRPDELGNWELMYTLPFTPISSKQLSI
jgi:hypothetical protein